MIMRNVPSSIKAIVDPDDDDKLLENIKAHLTKPLYEISALVRDKLVTNICRPLLVKGITFEVRHSLS